jgi:hypothetical protein
MNFSAETPLSPGFLSARHPALPDALSGGPVLYLYFIDVDRL